MYKRLYTLNYRGKTPSKKNQVRFARGKNGGIPRAYNSKDYSEFMKSLEVQFLAQLTPDEPIGACHIEVDLTFLT